MAQQVATVKQAVTANLPAVMEVGMEHLPAVMAEAVDTEHLQVVMAEAVVVDTGHLQVVTVVVVVVDTERLQVVTADNILSS
jgi:hypothetical protein